MEEALMQLRNSKTALGFWIYLMTDCILFATLFAVFAVAHGSTFGGPTAHEIFNQPYILTETFILLSSSFLCGLAILCSNLGRRGATTVLLVLSGLLGATFIGLELNEFHHLAVSGASWQRSGFLSAYFTLVSTHGLHITAGLIWLAILLVRLARRGLDEVTTKRLFLFSLFWHFLDLIWIFIFSLVYLVGGAIS